MKIIKGRAPLRVDLAGAWSDIPFYADEYGGVTVNAAINIYAEGEMQIEDNGQFQFKYKLEFPSGSGLGSSGALNVLFYTMINHKKFLDGELSKEDIALGAFKIERALGAKCGKQDQCASAFGGLMIYYFGSVKDQFGIKGKLPQKPEVRARSIHISDGRQGFSDRLLLIDTKVLHSSSEIINEIETDFTFNSHNYQRTSLNGYTKNHIYDMRLSALDLHHAFAPVNIKKEITRMQAIIDPSTGKEWMQEIRDIWLPTDWAMVGELISFQFDVMKQMSSKTTTEDIEKIISMIKPYIYGAKPGGAGGGGCIIVLCKSLEHKNDLKQLLENDSYLNQFDYHDVSIDNDGVQVWEV